MKRINILLSLLFFLSLGFTACEEEYKRVEEVVEEGIDYEALAKDAALEADFMILDKDGNEITETNMGEVVTFISKSKGLPSTRAWTVAGAKVSASDEKSFSTFFTSADATVGFSDQSVSLKVDRDGQSHTKSSTLKVNYIALAASFTTNMMEEDGKIKAFIGQEIVITDASTGLADSWAWEFTGSETPTSTEQSPTIKYMTEGTYSVKLTAKRSLDGLEDIDERIDYIEIMKPVLNVNSAIVDGDKVTITFDGAIMEELPANAKDDFTVTLSNSYKSYNATPTVAAIKRVSDNVVELTLSETTYADDRVVISLPEYPSNFKDITGFGAFNLSGETCYWGKSLVNGSFEDESIFVTQTSNKSTPEEWSYITKASTDGWTTDGAQGSTWVGFESDAEGISRIVTETPLEIADQAALGTVYISADVNGKAGEDGNLRFRIGKLTTSNTYADIAAFADVCTGEWTEVRQAITWKAADPDNLYYFHIQVATSSKIWVDNYKVYTEADIRP